ncbi:MAG: asparagine synthase (glutamine-hydrolyzing) [Bacteroidota bacterium]
MCGIAGIINFYGQGVQLTHLKKMTDVISHRGPDGEGLWVSSCGRIGFGHRRLSIIDLSTSASQPMHYLKDRYTITYNGEIYNYLEIKQELIKLGFDFHTDSDTEVILASYHIYREKCLAHFDGMFAFVLYDSVEQRVFCARDRFGEKPFHYIVHENVFYFASEIKQFWAAGIPKNIDEKKLLNYINNGQLESAENICATYYKNIFRLDAAHYFIIDLNNIGKIEQVNYWDIDLNAPKFSGSIEEASRIFYDLFLNSIKLRLRSDVPVGSSLSGGLDSSSIVMLIDELKGQDLVQNTFSARFKNFAKDEGEHITKVMESCKNLNVYYTWPDAEYFKEVFEKVVYHLDEPFGSASTVAQYAVMELAQKNGVTVLLDGQGADEILGGYLGYYNEYLNQLFHTSMPSYQKEFDAFNSLHRNNMISSPENDITFRMKLGRVKRSILRLESPFKNLLSKNLYYDTRINGLKQLLSFADRTSMAHSVEVRLPFLSHKLVEFVFSLPDNYKLNLGWTKYILRLAMNNTLPESICWRVDKIGYEPPQYIWLNDPYWQNQIKNASKLFDVTRQEVDGYKSNFNLDWRLLISSKFF